MSPNEQAILAVIRHSEGTDRGIDPYRVCYGFTHSIGSFQDHPAVTGEWLGVSIADLGPKYAHSISTAAGAYQINKPTWLELKAILKLPQPPYFTAVCQDAAALCLIREKGALELVNAGQLEMAIAKLADTWASLPGSSSGQPQKTLAALTEAFESAGGSLA